MVPPNYDVHCSSVSPMDSLKGNFNYGVDEFHNMNWWKFGLILAKEE